MFDPKEYYNFFQVNHFDYKQGCNRLLLELPDKEIDRLIAPIMDGSKEDFIRSVKIDIRFTFLLSIETLFELIFGLLPDKNNNINGENLLLKLVEKIQYYKDIRNYHKGEESKLDRLKEIIHFKNGNAAPLIRYIFFIDIWKEEFNKEIDNSLPVIENALRIFASELSNREELNSYKHGLRGIPFIKNLSFADPETLVEQFSYDFGDSVTIFSHDKKLKVMEYLTKSLDPERDLALTDISSNLINNIVQPRKKNFNNNISSKKQIISTFRQELLDKANTVNVNIQDFKIIKPSNKNTSK